MPLRSAILMVLILIAPAGAADIALSGAEIVERAIAAAGGETWKRPKTLILEGTMRLHENGAYENSLFGDTYRMWRVFPPFNDAAHAANGKVRLEVFSKGRLIFQTSFDGKTTYNEKGPVPGAVASREWSEAFGFGIIRFADNEGFKIDRLADDQVDGVMCHFVLVTDPTGETTIFGIEKETYGIRKVGFMTPRGWHERIYGDFAWAIEGKFIQPRRVRLFYNGRLTNDVEWKTYRVNEPIDDAIFVLPPG